MNDVKHYRKMTTTSPRPEAECNDEGIGAQEAGTSSKKSSRKKFHLITPRTILSSAVLVLLLLNIVGINPQLATDLQVIRTFFSIEEGAVKSPAQVQNSTRTGTLSEAPQGFQPKDFGSIVTDDFLQSCVESSYHFFKNNLTKKDTRPALELYKLSDCIRMCHCYHPPFCGGKTPCNWKSLNKRNKNKRFPADTISELYMREACPRTSNDTDKHLEIVDRIFSEKRGRPGFDIIPNRTTFLIHLRLGDLISDQFTPTDVLTILKKGGTSKPTKGVYFPSVVEYLQEIHKATKYYGYDSVELIGGSHQGGKKALKGMVYAKCLEESIRKAGYNVTAQTSQGYHPDVHFFYASHATRVLVSGGGYSRLIGEMAQRLGGVDLGPLSPPVGGDPRAHPTNKSARRRNVI